MLQGTVSIKYYFASYEEVLPVAIIACEMMGFDGGNFLKQALKQKMKEAWKGDTLTH